MRRTILIFWFCFVIAISIASPAQTLTTLYNFCSQDNCTDGIFPNAGLVQATDTNLYSTTTVGGTSFDGTVFEITLGGALTTLHSFSGPDGGNVLAGVIQASDGNFYGTTSNGGTHDDPTCHGGSFVGCGTLYKITSEGALTTLYNFCAKKFCSDGSNPGGLVQGKDGYLYGIAGTHNGGTIFRITTGGMLTTLYSFCLMENCLDGKYPRDLVQGADGNFYGTTVQGGTGRSCDGDYSVGCGTIFKMTPDGELTTLHSFDQNDGCYPEVGLVQGTDGNLYGSTSAGGLNGCQSGSGTIFKITPGGALTTLYYFCSLQNCTDGRFPNAALMQATDGNFYGTTTAGGANGDRGTIFRITPGGAFTTLYSFCALQNCADGLFPSGALLQAADGNLYGTTYGGGAQSSGTVFRLDIHSTLSVAKSGVGVVISGDGHIYCGNGCTYSYIDGTQVGLTAIPAPGYTFSNWVGCDNVNGDFCSVTMDSAKNVTATFTTSNVGLTSLVLNPSSVKGGNISIATVTLNAPAPPGGLGVGVATNSPVVVHPPSTVLIPEGRTSYSFAVRTSVVRMTTVANIIASAGASQVNATLTVTTGYSSSQAPSSN
jgi:uncharacterized repeat protein (TIGR03803 family)